MGTQELSCSYPKTSNSLFHDVSQSSCQAQTSSNLTGCSRGTSSTCACFLSQWMRCQSKNATGQHNFHMWCALKRCFIVFIATSYSHDFPFVSKLDWKNLQETPSFMEENNRDVQQMFQAQVVSVCLIWLLDDLQDALLFIFRKSHALILGLLLLFSGFKDDFKRYEVVDVVTFRWKSH